MPTRLVFIFALALTTAQAALIELPEPPDLTPAGRALIYAYEVGGGREYYERFLQRPTWPGAASGVTVGIGYDAGYNTRATILKDWGKHPDAARLAGAAGVTGRSAKALIPGLRDILIRWELAEEVFTLTTLTKFYELTARTYPGLEALHPDAQAALVSLVFNRGSSLKGERRREMRAIRDLVPKRDYAGIAAQLRSMKRIWMGTDIETGMKRRREAEARLVESCGK